MERMKGINQSIDGHMDKLYVRLGQCYKEKQSKERSIGSIAVLHRVVRVGLTEKVIFGLKEVEK